MKEHFFLFIAMMAILSPLLGIYMAKVFQGEITYLGWFEKITYRFCGINPEEEMNWKQYTKGLLLINLIGLLAIFLLHLVQEYLPLNPQRLPATSIDLAFNTSISFVTNTNWQSYSGETTLSYATQMVGLAVQNFLSAASGMAVLIALIRGLTRKLEGHIGNFWKDLIKTTYYILLPLSILLAFILVNEGVPQTFSPYVELTTLEGKKQSIPLGPVASQISIKQLGSNGGGFFSTNSAHPFENPTPLSNFVEHLAILLIPVASVFMYGSMLERRKHGWTILAVMTALWLCGLVISWTYQAPLPNMEGQEIRFGRFPSILWSVSTTATSNGSVNCMHSSLSPISGGIALVNMMLGELIFGGIGVGLCSMIMFMLLTLFLSGLMIGRTPEYLGKKIEKREVQWMTVAILGPGALILIGSGISCIGLAYSGPHGLTEILYAFTSCASNNGSAFAGLNANTPYYNIVLGVVMLLGRLAIVIPSLAIAGLFAQKKTAPTTAGTFSTESFLFASLLFSIILIVGALTFFPALSLGPIIEQFLMLQGKTV